MNDRKLKAMIDQAIKDADAFLDERAALVKKTCASVPLASIRQSIVGHFAGCPCRAALNVMEKDR